MTYTPEEQAVIDSILDGTIVEFTNRKITVVKSSVFREATALTKVDAPEVITMDGSAFRDCTALMEVNCPKLENLRGGHTFRGDIALRRAMFPKLNRAATGWEFENCRSLEIAEIALNPQRSTVFNNCYSLTTLILRNETLPTLNGTTVGTNTQIDAGNGYIYVPRALIEDYKVATNWSVYADQYRVLEDCTVDGTITGELKIYKVDTDLHGVVLSNINPFALDFYQTTVIPMSDREITEILVTMDGVDITSSAYSDGVINIPVVTGDISIVAKTDMSIALSLLPLNGALHGKLPRGSLQVTAGQKLRLHYYLTLKGGFVYDGRLCGSGYYNNLGSAYGYVTKDVTIVSDGTIIFSDQYNIGTEDGNISTAATCAVEGRYLYVEILE